MFFDFEVQMTNYQNQSQSVSLELQLVSLVFLIKQFLNRYLDKVLYFNLLSCKIGKNSEKYLF